MVRDELQAEILRLQDELHKTIVFVTHDIDEAIKLKPGCRVRPRRCLQQYDEPARCCPTRQRFRLGFIGADRGYRVCSSITPPGSCVARRPQP